MSKRSRINKQQLPREAFAVLGTRDDPLSWQLPHHTRAILKNGHRESNVNWQMMSTAVEYLSRQGHNGKRVDADLENIIRAAKHLASHYNEAARSVPLALGIMV